MEFVDDENTLHWLPFNIEYNGPADVRKYFIVEKDGDKLVAHFRGRKLTGRILNIQEGDTNGYLLGRRGKAVKEVANYEKIVYWTRENAPYPMEERIKDLVEIGKCLGED